MKHFFSIFLQILYFQISIVLPLTCTLTIGNVNITADQRNFRERSEETVKSYAIHQTQPDEKQKCGKNKIRNHKNKINKKNKIS